MRKNLSIGSLKGLCLALALGSVALSESSLAGSLQSEGATKLLSESLLGTVALLDQGTAFANEAGLDAMLASDKSGQSSFGALGAGYSKYNTGSRVKLYSASALVGYNVKFDLATLGAFLESGAGQSEGKVGNQEADGDSTYYGAGLVASIDSENRAYARVLARAGAARNKFKGYTSSKKDAYSDTNFYTSASLSLGRVVTLENKLDVDFYARYTFNFLKGGTTATSATGACFEASDVKTHAARVGFRMSAGKDDTLRIMSGLAYERVFSGEAKAKLGGAQIDAPDLEGNIGILEVGARYMPNRNWTLSLTAKGYFFTRQGITGEANAQYRF